MYVDRSETPWVSLALTLLVTLALASVREPPSQTPSEQSGILIFVEPSPDSVHWRQGWLNLSTGESGLLGYVTGSEPFYVDDRHGVWSLFSGERRHDGSGILQIRRDGDGIATRFLRDTMALSVSPDGTHVVIPADPNNWHTQLHLGRVTDDGLVREAALGVEWSETQVFGWFDHHTILAWDNNLDLVRVTPGASPVRLRHIGMVSEGDASHDMTSFAWVGDWADDKHVDLHIASLTDDSPERIIPLGFGPDGKCEFAPGDATLVCMVGDAYLGDVRVLAVEVATGAVTPLSDLAGTSIVFSPDGRHVVLFEDEMTIVSLDDTRQRFGLGRFGAGYAWLL